MPFWLPSCSISPPGPRPGGFPNWGCCQRPSPIQCGRGMCARSLNRPCCASLRLWYSGVPASATPLRAAANRDVASARRCSRSKGLGGDFCSPLFSRASTRSGACAARSRTAFSKGSHKPHRRCRWPVIDCGPPRLEACLTPPHMIKKSRTAAESVTL